MNGMTYVIAIGTEFYFVRKTIDYLKGANNAVVAVKPSVINRIRHGRTLK